MGLYDFQLSLRLLVVLPSLVRDERHKEDDGLLIGVSLSLSLFLSLSVYVYRRRAFREKRGKSTCFFYFIFPVYGHVGSLPS